MNIEDTAKVLAKCVAFDNRKDTDETILAWAEALDDMPLADALGFVRDHYATSREWIMPADLNRAWDQLKKARLRAIPQARRPVAPQECTPTESLIFQRAVIKAIGEGADQAGAAAAGFAAIDQDVPTIEATTVREIDYDQVGRRI